MHYRYRSGGVLWHIGPRWFSLGRTFLAYPYDGCSTRNHRCLYFEWLHWTNVLLKLNTQSCNVVPSSFRHFNLDYLLHSEAKMIGQVAVLHLYGAFIRNWEAVSRVDDPSRQPWRWLQQAGDGSALVNIGGWGSRGGVQHLFGICPKKIRHCCWERSSARDMMSCVWDVAAFSAGFAIFTQVQEAEKQIPLLVKAAEKQA
jgi:hypothetical protein